MSPPHDDLQKRVRELENAAPEYARYVEDLMIFQNIISSTPDGIAFLDREYRYVIVNDAYERFSGVNRKEFMGLTIAEYLGREVFETFIKENFDRCLQGETINYQEWFDFPTLGKRYMDVFYYPYRDRGNLIKGVIANSRDITERYYADTEQRITLSLLKTLHEQTDLRGLAKKFTALMQEFSGCEAVAIRLRHGEDYPFFVTKGFAEQFVAMENRLCAMDSQGGIVRDAQGNAVLECMCGHVINGHCDSALPFFSEGGTFWTNSTTALLESMKDREPGMSLRGHCHAEGYESVALIPLLAGKQRIGLLQFNDRRQDWFEEWQIGLYERLASQLAIAIVERKTAKELRDSEEKYKNLINNLPGAAYQFVLSVDGQMRFSFMGDGCKQLFGLTSGEVLADSAKVFDRIPPADVARVQEAIQHSARTLNPYEVEHRVRDYRNEIRWIATVSNPQRKANGDTFWDGFALDITTRKKAEEKLLTSYQDIADREHIASMFLTSSPESLYNDILDRLRKRFGARFGYIGYIDDDGSLVCPSMTRNVWDECRIPGKNVFFPRRCWAGIWGESLLRQTSLRQNEDLQVPAKHIAIHNALVVPLLAEDCLVGQIALANTAHGFSAEDQRQLESYAEFIAPVLKIHLEKEEIHTQLRSSIHKLEQTNIALNVLIDKRKNEKQELSRTIQENFDKLVFPYYQTITHSHSKEEILTIIEVLKHNTHTSLQSLETPSAKGYLELSPRELQIADFITAGKSSKDIASLLNISTRSVFFHRNNIRKKLGIHKAGTNLRTYLQHLKP